MKPEVDEVSSDDDDDDDDYGDDRGSDHKDMIIPEIEKDGSRRVSWGDVGCDASSIDSGVAADKQDDHPSLQELSSQSSGETDSMEEDDIVDSNIVRATRSRSNPAMTIESILMDATTNNSSFGRTTRRCATEIEDDEDDVFRTSVLSASDRRDILMAASLQMKAQDQERRRRGSGSDVSSADVRTSVSSPATLEYPLREKLRRLSRSQRKDLLRRLGAPIQVSPIHSMGMTTSPSFLSSNNSDELLFEAPYIMASSKDPSWDGARRKGRNSSTRSRSFSTASTSRKPKDPVNDIKLHIYDLISQDTLMQLPWGCVCEIGKVFNEVNSALHQLGTGAYHVGVEINGVEYAYGATSAPGKSGVFSCIPKLSPGYQFRTTIDFGKRPLVRKRWRLKQMDDNGKVTTTFEQDYEHIDGRQVMKEMAQEYMGVDYDILRKNCCTFARDACLRLGVDEHEIPSWFRNLSESGAMTQDFALATVEPLSKVLSTCDGDGGVRELVEPGESGFEIVAKRNVSGTKDLLVVMSATQLAMSADEIAKAVRRTATWAL